MQNTAGIFNTDAPVTQTGATTSTASASVNGNFTANVGARCREGKEQRNRLIGEGLKRLRAYRNAKKTSADLVAKLATPRVVVMMFKGDDAESAVNTVLSTLDQFGLDGDLKSQVYSVPAEDGGPNVLFTYSAFVPEDGESQLLTNIWDRALNHIIAVLGAWGADVTMKVSHIDYDEAITNLNKDWIHVPENVVYSGDSSED